MSVEGNRSAPTGPAVLVMTVDDGRIVHANDEVAALVGLDSVDAVIGLDALGFLHEDDQPPAREALKNLGEPPPLHVREFVRADGSLGRIEVSATPAQWNGRPARRWIGWPLPDNAAEVVAARDGLRITAANDEAVRFYGAQSVEDLLGRPLSELFADTEQASVVAHLGAAWTRGAPAPVQMWAVQRLDGQVSRGRFWATPAQEIDGAMAFRLCAWHAQPVQPAQSLEGLEGLEGLDYADSHRVLVDELGTIIDANQPAVEQLGLTRRDELVGRSLFEFAPGFQSHATASERWRELVDADEPSPLRLRVAKRVDGEERCVLSATVPGPVVDGRRTVWVSSWTINGPANEPITTKAPVGYLINEAWRLEQRTAAQEQAIAAVADELRTDVRQAAGAGAAIVALAARVDQLETHLKAQRDGVARLQVQMKQVLTAAGALGERATELVKSDPELAVQLQELLLSVATVGRQLGSMVSGAAEASEPS